jgi:hypothetical protein
VGQVGDVLDVREVGDVLDVSQVGDVLDVREVGDVTNVRHVRLVLHMRDVGQMSRMGFACRDADGGRGEQATVLERFHHARGGGGSSHSSGAAARFRIRMTGKHIHLVKHRADPTFERPLRRRAINPMRFPCRSCDGPWRSRLKGGDTGPGWFQAF